MAQRKYTNKDLPQQPVDDFQPDEPSDQSISGQSMQSGQMEDDFQPDEQEIDPEIAKQQRLAAAPEIVSRARGTIPAAANEDQGYWRSLASGEAADMGLRSGLQALYRATLGLPETAINTVVGLGNLAGSLYDDPMGTIKGIPSAIGQGLESMYQTYAHAGSNPEAWGDLIGETLISPATTAGVMGAAPYAVRGAGYPTALTGTAMRRFQPISTAVGYKTTGFPFKMPMLRQAERWAGEGIENLGDWMKNWKKTPPPVPPPTPTPRRGRPSNTNPPTNPPTSPPTNPPSPPPPGNPPGGPPPGVPPNVPPSVPPNVPPVTPPSTPPITPGGGGAATATGTSWIDDMFKELDARQAQVPPDAPPPTTLTPKRRLRLDPKRGTYIDLDTGEEIPINIDKTKPINPDAPDTPDVTTQQTGPPPRTIDNAPPNQRAKIMRGAHDPVDVFFENAADREIFGAGQSLVSKNENIRAGLLQRFKDASERIGKQYGLSEQKARELVHGYNEAIRNMGKQQPKYGDKIGDLNFKAPSFEEFLQSKINPKSGGPLDLFGNEKGVLNIPGGDPRIKLTAGSKGAYGRTFLEDMHGRIRGILRGDPKTIAEIPDNAQEFFDTALAPARLRTMVADINSAIEDFSKGQWAKNSMPGQVEELQSVMDWAKQYAEKLQDTSIPIRQRYFDAVKDIVDFKFDKK